MDYKVLKKELHYSKNLYGIVEEYAAVGDKRLDKLLDFIKGVSGDELDDMAADLKGALKKRIKNGSVNEKIYEDDLGLYYDRQSQGYKFKESWMGGRKKRRKRTRRKRGGVPLGHRCGTNADCDKGLQCVLHDLLSGPQVDNNQRGVCKTSEGGRRRRRKRTRRRKKSKRRRRKKKRTKKKRRRRRRK